MSINETTPISDQRHEAPGDDRLDVLRMVEEGTITAEEAMRLLDALGLAERVKGGPAGQEAPVRARHVRIRVSNSESGKPRVNLVLPLNVVDAGLAVARRLAPKRLADVDMIRDAVLAGIRGPILDVDENGERVEIIVE